MSALFQSLILPPLPNKMKSPCEKNLVKCTTVDKKTSLSELTVVHKVYLKKTACLASCKDKACVHISKVKGVHHSEQIDHCSPLCMFMARAWWPVLLFASTLLWPSLWDCLSGSVWTSLQCSSVPSVFICFMLSLCLVVFLSGMPALTLSTTDLSILKIIGKCHHSFSSAQSLQKRITLPPAPTFLCLKNKTIFSS